VTSADRFVVGGLGEVALGAVLAEAGEGDVGVHVGGEDVAGAVADEVIAASQRVEHYEMAGYGAARDFAKLLGMSGVASLLEQTLEEEKSADKKLTSIAVGVNKQAKQAA
jgi:ferritin-like metal-binding protein YciE